MKGFEVILFIVIISILVLSVEHIGHWASLKLGSASAAAFFS